MLFLAHDICGQINGHTDLRGCSCTPLQSHSRHDVHHLEGGVRCKA